MDTRTIKHIHYSHEIIAIRPHHDRCSRVAEKIMRVHVVQFVLLVLLASSARAASEDKSTATHISTQAAPTDTVTPTPLLIITPEPIAMQPSDLTTNVGLKTGRAYYKSDEDYAPPSGHSAFEVAQYPAGHSAHEGAWATADEHDHKSHDVDAVPYHNYHSAVSSWLRASP